MSVNTCTAFCTAGVTDLAPCSQLSQLSHSFLYCELNTPSNSRLRLSNQWNSSPSIVDFVCCRTSQQDYDLVYYTLLLGDYGNFLWLLRLASIDFTRFRNSRGRMTVEPMFLSRNTRASLVNEPLSFALSTSRSTKCARYIMQVEDFSPWLILKA